MEYPIIKKFLINPWPEWRTDWHRKPILLIGDSRLEGLIPKGELQCLAPSLFHRKYSQEVSTNSILMELRAALQSGEYTVDVCVIVALHSDIIRMQNREGKRCMYVKGRLPMTLKQEIYHTMMSLQEEFPDNIFVFTTPFTPDVFKYNKGPHIQIVEATDQAIPGIRYEDAVADFVQGWKKYFSSPVCELEQIFHRHFPPISKTLATVNGLIPNDVGLVKFWVGVIKFVYQFNKGRSQGKLQRAGPVIPMERRNVQPQSLLTHGEPLYGEDAEWMSDQDDLSGIVAENRNQPRSVAPAVSMAQPHPVASMLEQPRPIASTMDQPRSVAPAVSMGQPHPVASMLYQPRPVASTMDQPRSGASIMEQRHPVSQATEQPRPSTSRGDPPQKENAAAKKSEVKELKRSLKKVKKQLRKTRRKQRQTSASLKKLTRTVHRLKRDRYMTSSSSSSSSLDFTTTDDSE